VLYSITELILKYTFQFCAAYRNSLMHGESDNPPQIARRAYTRKRNPADDPEHEEMEDYQDGDMG